ncbi:MAG: hypothetical protein PHU44_05640 [Syntrophales bacterium]|nr:hypothetical protein [Syntrophales bacterium]
MAVELIPLILSRLPGSFATELGLDVKAGPAARQKWFLAAILHRSPCPIHYFDCQKTGN